MFDNKDVSQATYSKKTDVYNKAQTDLVLPHNEGIFTTQFPLIKKW